MPARLPLLAVLLLLASLLLAAGSAHGSEAPSAADPLALEEPFEGEAEEEGEVPDTECDTAHEEADEGQLGRDEAEEICEEEAEEDEEEESRSRRAGSNGQAPEECVLRSAHAHAAVNDKSNKLKLTLGYTAYEPVGAEIKVGNIATLQRHLGRSGVLRIVKPVGKRAPKRLTIRLDVAAVPGYCGKYQVEKVTVR